MEEVEECPWGNENVNLSGVKLCVNEKKWIAREISSGRTTVKAMCRKYNMVPKTVYNYVKLTRNGIPFYMGTGRPRIIDKTGFIKVVNKSYAQFPYARRPTGSYILNAYRETVSRRNPNICEAEMPEKVSERSRRRYISLVESVQRNMEGLDEVLQHFE